MRIHQKMTYSEQAEYYAQMDDNTMHALILYYEKQMDEFLRLGKITQEEAWNGYFELMNECDWRGFLEDFDRICGKIDTKRYNPLESKDPRVIQIVLFRAKMHGLI